MNIPRTTPVVALALLLTACGSADEHLTALCQSNGHSNKLCSCAAEKMEADTDPELFERMSILAEFTLETADLDRTPQVRAEIARHRADLFRRYGEAEMTAAAFRLNAALSDALKHCRTNG